MKRSRFTEEQIIGILREQEAGQKTADVCRRHGISEATFYTWKSTYGGMEVSDAKRLKVLETENAPQSPNILLRTGQISKKPEQGILDLISQKSLG